MKIIPPPAPHRHWVPKDGGHQLAMNAPQHCHKDLMDEKMAPDMFGFDGEMKNGTVRHGKFHPFVIGHPGTLW